GSGRVYGGRRGGGRRIEPVSAPLPATMASWCNVEVAGALGLLMNVGGPVPAFDRLANNSAEFRNGPVPDPVLSPYYRMASQASVVGRGAVMGGRPAAPNSRAGASARMSTNRTP